MSLSPQSLTVAENASRISSSGILSDPSWYSLVRKWTLEIFKFLTDEKIWCTYFSFGWRDEYNRANSGVPRGIISTDC